MDSLSPVFWGEGHERRDARGRATQEQLPGVRGCKALIEPPAPFVIRID